MEHELFLDENKVKVDNNASDAVRRSRSGSTTTSRVNTSITTMKPTPELTTYGIKLGWIQGVLIPCLLNIWGVMLFLRIAWIVAQAGIAYTTLIIAISAVVCVITTLSLSAICTNGKLQGGGVYYLVSRSLGAEFGASVGIIFAFANAVAASMNTIGFCESLNELLKRHNLKVFDNDVNDIRFIGTIALFVMCLICAIGMDWETKTQNFLITVIVLSIFNYIVGAFLGPFSHKEVAEGFVGVSAETFKMNLLPDYRVSDGTMHNFFSVFAMYFPAVTGVQAGANICGDLKEPAKAIPKGTLLALAISVTSYLVMAILAGAGALRDASGDPANTTIAVLQACVPNCSYGLHNNYEIMHTMALWPPLIYGGCWAATLSTALTNLLSVPRLIQALGFDRIYPGLIFFSKRYGRNGEPYRGYVLTFLVSATFLLIADLNRIAPLITIFYLASYSLINFCTFHAAFVEPISWRPTFRWYNKWLSLIGFALCVVIMMIISWAMALLNVFIFLTLYLIVHYRKPDVNWGSSADAQIYKETINKLWEMSQIVETSKSYNPRILVLAGPPYERHALVSVGYLISKIGSFMIVVDICKNTLKKSQRERRCEVGAEWMRETNSQAFYMVLDGLSKEDGVKVMMKISGLGRLSPNIVLLGFKTDWNNIGINELNSYVRIISDIYEEKLGITILRVAEDARRQIRQKKITINPRGSHNDRRDKKFHSVMAKVMSTDSEEGLSRSEQFEKNEEASEPFYETQNSPLSQEIVLNKDEVLDAWWLFDDGGLNVLIPYIIAKRSNNMALRIFGVANKDSIDATKNMASVLDKFRIRYDSLTMVSDFEDEPTNASWEFFNSLIKGYMQAPKEHGGRITEELLQRMRDKTVRHLRIRELLFQYSADVQFIVLTLPMPRKSVPAALYMSWLEILSRDLPPLLFVRGNDSSVITFEV